MSRVVKQFPRVSEKSQARRCLPSGLDPCRELAPAMTTQMELPRAGNQALELGCWHTRAFQTSTQHSEALWRSRTGYSSCTETTSGAGEPAVGKKWIISVVQGGQRKPGILPQIHNDAIAGS